MKISCVIARAVKKDAAEKLKEIGPLYGSWTTWKESRTDNVICTDLTKAYELMQKAFHAVCNFYIPKKFVDAHGTLPRVQTFTYNVDAINQDDLSATYIAADQDSSVVILVGFDFAEADKNLIEIIKKFNKVQFVGVTYAYQNTIAKGYKTLDNISFDTLDNVLKFANASN